MWSLVAFAEPWIAAPGIAETVRRFLYSCASSRKT
ncbi:hypothetical protein SFUMM280S_03480 [Streptomyces fumanus]